MTTKSPYIIVVGVDYSEVSRLAFREALNLASAHVGSEVHLVHVETTIQLIPVGVGDQVVAESVLRQTWTSPNLAAALEHLRRVAAEEVTAFERARHDRGSAPIARVVSHVRTSTPGREIAQLAADLEADMVIVGTHGRSAIARAFLGSVAHSVVNLAPCPVLVVRPKRILNVPAIEAPCPRCIEARRESGGRELWCDQHRDHHGQRHTYFQDDRAGLETNFPLVFDER
jgi:nucleotide-binding universal stress UspA family protein